MRRRKLLVSTAAAALCVGLALIAGAPAAPAADPGQLQVGAGVADASWHVGASAGQYAGDCPALEPPSGTPCTPVSHEDGTFDPTGHSTRRLPSYGIQSRLSARAIVVDGPDAGADDRFAIVKNDNYIPQDLVYRRAAQIVQEECPSCGISAQNLTMAVTHDHSSPYYSSTSWGVWTFQDVFDVRFFEYQAQQMAAAVEQAAQSLQPARVGVSSNNFDKTHRHSFGPAIADDGTPAGYPKSDTDHDMTVVRFDSTSGDPIANLINFSLHGEGLEGNDLISADWVAPLERMLDRETEAVTVYTQGAVGTSEPERSEWHSIHDRAEFSHRDYAQGEFGARLMANAAENAWQNIADATPEDPAKYIPFSSSPTVQMADQWYPGPLTHPYPTVSNCRADSTLAGDPLLPIVGLPDCDDADGALSNIGIPGPDEAGLPRVDPGLTTDDFQGAPVPIPVPENYGAPGYGGLEEDINIHLQVIRIGELLLPICSCEGWWDQSRNIELRTNKIFGDETLPGPPANPAAGNLGYDWGAQCTQDGNGTYTPQGTGTGSWHCPNPNSPAQPLPYALGDHEVKRMRAQVNNPANGWNDLTTLVLDPQHNPDSEPVDATQVKGNYTHDESNPNAGRGYDLTVPISMANDYNGYIATYREYQRGDHYRKALTGWGPHSSDYMSSRLVTLARLLNDPATPLPQDQIDEQFFAPKVLADLAINNLRAEALGMAGGAAIDAYTAQLPDDGGTAAPVTQPSDVERFGAAFFTWNGGSNFTDNPGVKVQRKVGNDWEDYADQSGELPVTVQYPQTGDLVPYEQGNQQWHWTAHFEAFVAGSGTDTFNTGDRAPATPAGTYRFVVDGDRRNGGGVVDYHLDSNEFQVKPWSGITVENFQFEPDNTMSFRIGPRHTYDAGGGVMDEIGPVDYPDSYQSPIRFIKNQRTAKRDPADPNNPDKVEWFCFTCSFRPWLDSGDGQTAMVKITHADATTELVPATAQGGRWVTTQALQPGESAVVETGAVLDPYGDFNGGASQVLSIPGPGPGPGPGGGGAGVGAGSSQAPSVPSAFASKCTTPVAGTSGDDQLSGGPGGDLIFGLLGNDKLFGLAGPDCLFGGQGEDLLRGSSGGDLVRGGDGHDNAGGGAGRDIVSGGRGPDGISGGPGNDRIRARDSGADTIDCGPGRDRAVISPNDKTVACERVRVVS